MTGKQITAALTGVVILASAGAALGIETVRPWAWAWDLREIAGVSLTTAINQKYDFLALERRELRLCEQAGQDCILILRRIQRLEQEIRDLEAKRAKYGG